MISALSTKVTLSTERHQFIQSVYKYLGGAILSFIVISALMLATGFSQQAARYLAASGSNWLWVGVLGAFMLVGWLASRWASSIDNPQKQLGGLGVYVVAESFITAPMLGIAQLVAPDAIAAAALITILLVAALTWTAFTAKTDFSFLGGLLKVGGIVALGTILVSLAFGFSLGIWFSGLMVVFAGGSVLYDTARVVRDYPTNLPVAAALSLFASIALMFWYVLRLLLSLASNAED